MRLTFACLVSLLAATDAVAKDVEPPVITHVRVHRAPAGQPMTVRAKIDDASEIFAPSVYFRNTGAIDFEAIEMRKDGDGYVARIAGDMVSGGIEYFIEAFDEQGNGPAREGSPETPIIVEVFEPSLAAPPPPPPPVGKPVPPTKKKTKITERWWFWAVLGIAVVGGTTAAVVALSGGDPEFVDVLVKGPDPVGGL